ncbi:sigma-70 family RNA polymerase sigma factor [Propioniciclava soli]|uniref:Sigma-70 family RNA polymerase sigma factor n=1 Tax=Propioniciclava soli TaxID=2775081 RepID=A0ABZ3C3E9_9ACTN
MIAAVGALQGMSVDSEGDFEALFAATSASVFAYARRHVEADVAADVVSEVYLVAWKRRHELPDEPVAWLLVTARHVVLRYWRTRSRQLRLMTELAGIQAMAATSDASVEERSALGAAFAALSADDREALLLVGWDGLTPQQAARVMGCSANTFAARLSRARRRLSNQAGDQRSLRLVALPAGADNG